MWYANAFFVTVISLHTAIKELEDEIENPDSIFNRTGAGKKKELGVLVQNCNGVLQRLNKLLIKYKSLGTGSKRAWDRLRWGTENLAEIREKIMSHTSSLNLFLTTLGTGSLGRIEKKLDQLIEDVRVGRREQTVLTMADNDEDEAEIQWNLWKNELVDDGFTKVELEGHKHWIKARLIELIEGGGLHEETLPEKGSASKSSLPNHSKNATSEITSISQSLKQPDNDVPSAKRPNLQATVEDAEDDGEDNEIREDVTVVWPKNRHPESKSFSSKEIAREDRGEKSDQELASEGLEESDASDSTDDTFLPSDSISNVGITTETCPALDTRTPQPLPSAAKKTSRPEGKAANPPPNLRRRDFNEGLPPPSPPLLGKSGNFTYEFNTNKGGEFSFRNPENIFSEFLRGQGNNLSIDDSENKNKTRRKQGRASADNTAGMEAEYVGRKDRKRYEPQPAKNNYSSPLRGEKSYDELKYDDSSRRDNRPNETRQTLPRKDPPSDDEYYDPDTSDATRRYTRKPDMMNEKESLKGGDWTENQPIYDFRRVEHTSRNPKFPSRPLDLRESRYTDPRDSRYIDPRDDQYVDPRDIRGTSTPIRDPRYFVPGINQGANYPPRPGRSDGYPFATSNPTEPGPYQFSTSSESSREFSFSNPESIFSEFLRGQAGMGGTNGTDEFSAIFGSDERGGGPISHSPAPEVTTVERPLPLTLEEIFNGTHKKMKIKRKVFDEITGTRSTQEKVLEMDCRPGIKKGGKIKFKGVGDQEAGGLQDLHFIIEEVSISIQNSLLTVN
jgi:hypothetical protein